MVEWQNFIDTRFYYEIDGWKTLSKFRALEKAKGDVSKVKFYCYDDVFSGLNWSRPKLAWPELLKIRCHQLRDHYDHLCLWFSGGWDSTTVLQAFVDNNIRLDELVIFRRTFTEDIEIQDAIEFANKVKREKWNDLLIKYVEFDHQHHTQIYESMGDQWIDSPGSNFMFPKLHRHFIHHKLDRGLRVKSHPGSRGEIEAHDKPKVYLHDNKWYCMIPDSSMVMYFGADVDLFYLNDQLPELHVSQVHLSIDYFENLFRREKKVDVKLIHLIQGYDSSTIYRYFAEWNQSIGRVCTGNQSAVHGYSKLRARFQGPNDDEGKKLLSYVQQTNELSYRIYTEGLNNISIATGYDLWQNSLPTILSKSYYVRDLAPDLY